MYNIFLFYHGFLSTTIPLNENYKRKLETGDLSKANKKIKLSENQTETSSSIDANNIIELEISASSNIETQEIETVSFSDKNTSNYDFGIPPCKECAQIQESAGVNHNIEKVENKHCIVFRDLKYVCVECLNHLYMLDFHSTNNYTVENNLNICHYICFEAAMHSFSKAYNNSEDKMIVLIDAFVTFKCLNTFMYNVICYIRKKYDITTNDKINLTKLYNDCFKIDGIHDVMHSITINMIKLEEIQNEFIKDSKRYQNFLKHIKLSNTEISKNNIENLDIEVKYTNIEFEELAHKNINLLKTFYPISQGNSLIINEATKFDRKYTANFLTTFKIKNITWIMREGPYNLDISEKFFSCNKLKFLIIFIIDYDRKSWDILNGTNITTEKLYIKCINESNENYKFCMDITILLENTKASEIYIENMSIYFLQLIFLDFVKKLPFLEILEILISASTIIGTRSLHTINTQIKPTIAIKIYKLNILSSITGQDLYTLMQIAKKIVSMQTLIINIVKTPSISSSSFKITTIEKLFNKFGVLNKLLFIYNDELGLGGINPSCNDIFSNLFRITKTLHFKVKKFPEILFYMSYTFLILEKIIFSDTVIKLQYFIGFLGKCEKINKIEINNCVFENLEISISFNNKINIDMLYVNGIYIHDLVYFIRFFNINELIIFNLNQKNSEKFTVSRIESNEIEKIFIYDSNKSVIKTFIEMIKYKELNVMT